MKHAKQWSIKFYTTEDEEKRLNNKLIEIKRLALDNNIRLTKAAICKKMFLECLENEDFIKKIIN